jgi:protein ImuB
MKSHRRHAGSRHAVAARWATADLFADDVGAGPAAPKAPTHATAPINAKTPTEAQASGVRCVPPLTRPTAKPRTLQLWYAAVFPEFAQPQSQPQPQQAAQAAASMLQRLCLSAQQFTPFVSLDMPNALLLEIKGSVKLFGSLTALHEAIDALWRGFSLRAQSAAAPTALAALWCARSGKRVAIEDPGLLAGELAELPIACTSWNVEWLQTLRSMGVTRMGELLRLPRAGLARRLSPAAVLDIDIALARQAAPRRAFIPRERFHARCDFETEIETVVYLQKALEPLIERCAQFLRERQAGVQALELKLRHRVIPLTRVRVGLASITSERHRLANVLDENLHRLALAAPVRGMELSSGPLQPLSSDSLDAFAGLRAGGRDTAPQLVERLRARLGEEAVYGLCSIAEHRPEAAWRRVQELRLTSAVRVPVRAAARAAVRVPEAPATDMPRPVWLLDEPVLLSAHPHALLERGLRLEQGPERIESGWWDGKDVERDYYVARQRKGARWWVFQERQTRSWYLHGLFA